MFASLDVRAAYAMDNFTLHDDPGLRLGEGAIGGMIPTSIAILLLAILRIVKIYSQRRRQYNDAPDKDMSI